MKFALHAYLMFYHLARYIKLKNFLFSFHLTMMTWSHRNVVLNFFRSFLSLDVKVKYVLKKKSRLASLVKSNQLVVFLCTEYPAAECNMRKRWGIYTYLQVKSSQFLFNI